MRPTSMRDYASQAQRRLLDQSLNVQQLEYILGGKSGT